MNSVSRIKKVFKEFAFFILERFSSLFDIKRPIDNKAVIKKILVFEGGCIGDLMRVFPAIESLNTNFPTASISLVVSPGAKGLLSIFPKRHIISEVIDYDLTGRHKSLLKKLSLVFSLRKERYDLIYSPDRGNGMR